MKFINKIFKKTKKNKEPEFVYVKSDLEKSIDAFLNNSNEALLGIAKALDNWKSPL